MRGAGAPSAHNNDVTPLLRRPARLVTALGLAGTVALAGCTSAPTVGDVSVGAGVSATTDAGSVVLANSAIAAGAGTKVLLVLDQSGSMATRDAAGVTRLQAAQRAMASVVDSLPDGTNVGLRVYGATVRVAGKAMPGSAACTDTQLVVPIGPIDRTALKQKVAGARSYGDTPISYSLEKAIGDLGTDGPRSVVLVSDGEESCSADPCATAMRLAGSGVSLHVNTVGLQTTGTARSQLQCIADKTGGKYYDAADNASLAGMLQQAVDGARGVGTSISAPSVSWGSGAVSPGVVGAILLLLLLLYLLLRSGSRTR